MSFKHTEMIFLRYKNTVRNFDAFFDKFKFMDFLKLTNVDDLFTVCDQDNDGFLNEDEQILVFSLIKVKMLTLADKLCKIQKYTLYKKLMAAMR